ncbi:GNAT family N-acetyltransferase [Streptomyces sp. NPDC047981]|uniref:GNAT family N-acetyltransferase n=1 Tax=Streptomyces sp. NPDC047981 TaxID=3154610 RepID=UPI003426F4BB
MADDTALRLEKITPDNIDAALALRVHPHQEKNVASVAHSLAEAYAFGATAWPRLILDGDEVVGFLMAFLDIQWAPEKDPDDRRSGLWRLNIAADRQGKGYGRFAVESVRQEIRRRGGDEPGPETGPGSTAPRSMYVTWEPGEEGPEGFYLGLGFRPTGETSGRQTVGVLDL